MRCRRGVTCADKRSDPFEGRRWRRRSVVALGLLCALGALVPGPARAAETGMEQQELARAA
ncbi:MAG: hypothetical protein H6Q85_1692, partial [candidate division NC10 bacterium]|nr:hypothetical protein [candidate division NC10 bacterium]